MLERVDTELRGGKGLTTVWGRCNHYDRDVPDLESADPMEQHQTADLRPPGACLLRHRGQAWNDVFEIGLVLQRRHTRTSVGVVANCAAKRDDAATTGKNRPLQRPIERESALADPDPITRLRRVELAHCHSVDRSSANTVMR